MAVDLEHLPEGVVILPAPSDDTATVDPQAWIEAVRRATPRPLRQQVAEHLSQARELGEV